MVPIKNISKNEDLTAKVGFICNSQAQWFTIRKIDNVWYNLNSTNKRLP
jgi:ataxin-3